MKLGFISDAHGNYQALLKAIDVLQKEKVNEIFFLGDAIGYFDSPEIPFYLQKNNIVALKGNHEEMVITKNVPENKQSIYRLNQHFDSSLISVIASWPQEISKTINKRRIHMVHGSIENPIWGYTHESFVPNLELNYDLFICGATHRPFIKIFNEKIWANIGSCGFPRDIGNQGSCGIYDTKNHIFSILRFDISDTISFLRSTHKNLDKTVLAIWERR